MAEEQKKVTKKRVAKKKVAKKKVAKKRVVRRKVNTVADLLERATERGSFSQANKEGVRQYKTSQTAMNQANKKVETAKARVEKASAAVGNAKSAKQKDLAKTRLAAAKVAVREAVMQGRQVAKDERSAVVLLAKLDKLYAKAHAAFLRSYEKDARKAAKPRKMKRRAAKKKAVKKD